MNVIGKAAIAAGVGGLTFLATALFDTAQAGCAGPGIDHLRVPVDYHAADRQTFELSYRLRPGITADAPLVIVVPGGPGGTLIHDDVHVSSGGIPADFGVVLTDQRGAGCNDDPALNADGDFSSEFLARDLLAIVAELEQRQHVRRLDYILYGQSYGTLVATMASSLAPRLAVTPPRVTVLEGTLGRSFDSYAEYFQVFEAEWRRVRDTLPRRWRNFFSSGDLGAVPATSSLSWAVLVNNDLMRGYRPDGLHELEWQLSPEGLSSLPGALHMFPTGSAADALIARNRLLRVVACTELFGDLYPLRDLRDGELVLRGDNLCAGHDSLTHPFDAANWPVATPLVYFQGEHDPATSFSQARHHFESEVQAPRYFVSVDEAAHAALSITLNTGDCPARLWNAIADNLSGFAAAVAHCDELEARAHVALEYQPGVLASIASN
jgi:pimeloyl-ACP methyl ester carboxylesterase